MLIAEDNDSPVLVNAYGSDVESHGRGLSKVAGGSLPVELGPRAESPCNELTIKKALASCLMHRGPYLSRLVI